EYAQTHFSYETNHQRLAQLIGPAAVRQVTAGKTRSERAEPEGSPNEVQTLIVCASNEEEVLSMRVVDTYLSAEPTHPNNLVVLVPQEHARTFLNRNVLVETFSSRTASLSANEQARYEESRIVRTLSEYASREVILNSRSTVKEPIHNVPVRTFAEVLSEDSSATTSIPIVSGSKPGLKQQMQHRTQRLRQYTIENAPRPVIKTATGIKHGIKRAKLSSMRSLTPHTTFFAKRSDIPLLKPRSRQALFEAPSVLFVVEDQNLDPREAVKKALERALSSGAFNPVFLAPTNWLVAAEEYDATIETFETRYISHDYLKNRIDTTVTEYQPVNVLRLAHQQEEPQAALHGQLDVAEVVAAQRYV